MFTPRTRTNSLTSRRVFLCSEIGGISTQIYGLLSSFRTPVRSLYGAVLGGTEGSSLSCYNTHSNSSPTMPRTGTICVGAKHSTTSTRRSSAKTASRVSNPDADQSISDVLIELTEAYKVEKDAKNKAYYFILSNGLLDRFTDFCKNYHSCDPHKDCIEYLLSKC